MGVRFPLGVQNSRKYKSQKSKEMMYILDIFILVVLILILIIFIIQFFNIAFRSFAPFIPSNRKAKQEAIRKLEMKEDGVLYELGCGDAGLLRIARKKFPKAKLIGIEYFSLPFLIAKIQDALTKSKLILLKKNFFNVNLSDANAIYCFLNIQQMIKLKPKLEKECKPGTILISYHFTLPDKQYEKVVEIENKNKIYFYKL